MMFTAWVDKRVDRFAVAFADRLIEKSGLDQAGDQFGSFLIGLNDQITNI